MSHDISVETCCNVEINKETIGRFDVFDYVPQGYETKNMIMVLLPGICPLKVGTGCIHFRIMQRERN